VDNRGRLEGVVRPLVPQQGFGDCAELVVNQRSQRIHGLPIAFFPPSEKTGNLSWFRVRQPSEYTKDEPATGAARSKSPISMPPVLMLNRDHQLGLWNRSDGHGR